MSYLIVEDLELRYGSHQALDRVSFAIAAGERLCLLGPSGCGKTTTLQIIAGFAVPDAGHVRVDRRDMAGIPPEKRNIGIMFQNYALFPHLTVFDNVAFGLRMRGVKRAELQRRVRAALELVRLPHVIAKHPRQLSGGEQQRIAFARAVVIQPSLLLLDEPFSNLDARLRLEMRSELLNLLQTLNIATVMVTHDQEEAMAIADRIAVMRAGRIEQVGSASDIYDSPASLFVAQFVGESNVFDATVAACTANGVDVDTPGLGRLIAKPQRGLGVAQQVRVLIRPERIHLRADSDPVPEGWNRFPAVVEQIVYLGHRTECRVQCGGHRFVLWDAMPPPAGLRPHSHVAIEWRHADTLLVAREATPGAR
jgi:ABC-type Fe3+/spermidine/putrescine transport system ATPase subunit